jgi:hypothetical protein
MECPILARHFHQMRVRAMSVISDCRRVHRFRFRWRDCTGSLQDLTRLSRFSGLKSRTVFESSARSMAFSTVTTAAALLGSLPDTAVPSTDVDHFHTPRLMPWTTVYSMSRYLPVHNESSWRQRNGRSLI